MKWSINAGGATIKPGQINGDLDARLAGAGHIIQVGDTYEIYYWAVGSDGAYRICKAKSTVKDPNKWEPMGSVLERQPDNKYNCSGPGFPCVVPRDDGPWMMYICMWGNWQTGGKISNTTGVALSYDKGKTWKYSDENPVIPLDRPYDKEGTGSTWVLYEDGLFRMYYVAIGKYYKRPEGVKTGHGDTIPEIGIAYATSKDGIHWTKPLDHLLISPRRFETEPYEYISSKPCIVKEDGGYRMWVNSFGTAYRIRSLTSSDGLHWKWNPSGPDGELGVGSKDSFDNVQRSYICVVKHKDEYRCWYTGNGFGSTGMGYGTGKFEKNSEQESKTKKPSTVTWSRGSSEPVIKPGLNGELDAKRASCAEIVEVGDSYYVYYWGEGSDGAYRICMAKSSVDNPNKWEPMGSVLERQPDKEYNAIGPSSPSVVARDDGPWLMYVCMWGSWRADKKHHQHTGVALSYDKGKTWKYADENPVFPLERPYEKEATASVHVSYEDGLFRMYYTAFGDYYKRPEGVKAGHGDIIPDVGIAYATSKDGIHWTKPFEHPLISPRRFEADPYEYMCAKPCIIKDDGVYRMWVNTFSTAYRIRSLTSSDGLHWRWNPSGPEGEIGVGEKGAFDDFQRSYICVVKHKDEYRCWYTGNGFGVTGIGYATGKVKEIR